MRENKEAAPMLQHRDGEERTDAGCAGMYGSEAHFNTQRGRISSVLAAFPGFYLARNPGELDRYLKSLDHRIGEISDTYTAMARMRDEWRGQLRIEGWETNDGEE